MTGLKSTDTTDDAQKEWQKFVLALIIGAMDEAYTGLLTQDKIIDTKLHVAKIAFNGL